MIFNSNKKDIFTSRASSTHFFQGKKGIVTLTMFSLIIISVLFILLFSYYFYDYVKDEGLNAKKDQEVLNSITSFRSELLTLIPYNNSNITYSNNLDSVDLQIYLAETSITGTGDTGKKILTEEISTLGYTFCSSYVITPQINSTLVYNGSCISVN